MQGITGTGLVEQSELEFNVAKASRMVKGLWAEHGGRAWFGDRITAKT